MPSLMFQKGSRKTTYLSTFSTLLVRKTKLLLEEEKRFSFFFTLGQDKLTRKLVPIFFDWAPKELGGT